MSIRAISYGGGVQSTALIVLAARKEIDFSVALFSNVGDDSEHPATLAYVRDVAMPYAAEHGIELLMLEKVLKSGEHDTLMKRIDRDERSIPIPMRLSGGKPGNRTCTAEFKINVIRKELVRRGATKTNIANLALGISLDEYQRMKPARDARIRHLWPLIERRLSRADCINIISREGIPVPPKSSCYFCPFHTKAAWKRMLKEEPDLFAKSVALERKMNERRLSLGRDVIWLTDSLRPLDEAITDDGQMDMFEDGATCDIGGYCHS
jgi:hypothetical protein